MGCKCAEEHFSCEGSRSSVQVLRAATCCAVFVKSQRASRTKTELVNYKKVMLHLQRSFEEAESDLAVFGAILFAGEGSASGGDATSSSANDGDKATRRNQVKLSQELDALRGMLHVIRSVRSSTSLICKTSRFPPPNASTSSRMFIASGLLRASST